MHQSVDWNTADIDWQGHGWGRGLRGIAFDGDTVYIAASDELLAYSPDFKPLGSWKSPFLKHCHEICVWQRMLYLTSSGFDSILGFDLDEQRFTWAIQVQAENYRFKALAFDPMGEDGPLMLNKLHINNVYCNEQGMYVSGSRTGGMLHFNGKHVHMAVQLPPGTHDARPFRDGVLFNDSNDDVLRYTGRGEGEEDRAMPVPQYDPAELDPIDAADSKQARQGFARGLCVLSDRIVAGGSSPATISAYDLAENKRLLSVSLSKDVRNAIHGLERWPYE